MRRQRAAAEIGAGSDKAAMPPVRPAASIGGDDRKPPSAPAGQDIGDAQQPSEADLDQTLADSMAASDPPSFGGSTGVVAAPLPEASEEESRGVRELAYRLWEEAGRPQDQELEFWLEAERRLARG